MGLVLFDLDGTLISGSSERAFIAHLAVRRRLGWRQAAAAARFLVREAPVDGHRAFKRNKAYLAGLEVDEVARLAEAFVPGLLAARQRPEVMHRLSQHREAGDAVALLTGAPDFIAAPVARAVGADLWRASRCPAAHGRFAAGAPESHPFGAGKVAVAEALCAALGTSLEACTAYADAGHDAALLARVARPVAVAPDRRLERLARARGWEVLDGGDAVAAPRRVRALFGFAR